MGLSTLLTGLVSWPYAPLVLGAAVVGLLYGLGARRLEQTNQPQRLQWWNYAAFAAGLLLLVVALHPALDSLAHQWFWVHMMQNEALAVPLLTVMTMFG